MASSGWRANLRSPVAGAVLVANATVRDRLRRGLAAYNAENPASSTRIGRVLLLTEPPSIDANEITDKGYINQRAVLERRSELVETLYGDGVEVSSAEVLSIE